MLNIIWEEIIYVMTTNRREKSSYDDEAKILYDLSITRQCNHVIEDLKIVVIEKKEDSVRLWILP